MYPFSSKNVKVCHPKSLASLCRYGIGPSCRVYCIVLCIVFGLVNRHSLLKKRKKKKKIKKPRSLRYIDTDFRWADSRGIRYNRFYVIANYVISVVTCIYFKWSSAGPRRGLRNNRELRYAIDCLHIVACPCNSYQRLPRTPMHTRVSAMYAANR